MRLIVILVLVLFIAAGVVLGALNADLIGYDLAFAQVHVPKGAALLVVLSLGWALGGLTAWLGMGSRQRRVQKAQRRAEKKLPGNS
jgi:uncharacterized membrane protein YciS (DUF1049 family)